MDPERWARAKEIFHAALECEPSRREPLLEARCGGDEALRGTVRAMLARQPQAVGFLETPALQVEAKALAVDLSRDPGAESEWPRAGAGPPPALPGRRPRSAWWLHVVAAAFLVDVLLRAWCFDFGPEGFGFTTRVVAGRHVVAATAAGGLAAGAGIRPGDVIAALDGEPFERASDTRITVPNLEIGRTYRFEVERGGGRLQASIAMRRVEALGGREREVRLLWQAGQLVLLAVAFLIAFKRPRDPVALLGSLALAIISVAQYTTNLPPGYAVAWRRIPAALGWLLWIPNVSISLMGPVGLSFFTRFPRRLFQARWPRLLIWLPALAFVPLNLRSIFLVVHRPEQAFGRILSQRVADAEVAVFALYGLAMIAAAAANYRRLDDVNEKRRLGLLLAGGAIGALPALLRFLVIGVAPRSALHEFLMRPWQDIFFASVFLVFPLSFAYAVLRHRLLGITVIVRLGLQYAVARGLLISLVPVLALAAVADALAHGSMPLRDVLLARGWVYLLLGAAALFAHSQRRRWGRAIDRRFFREQYDAGQLLRDVAEHARRAGALRGAAPLVVARIEAALHPEFATLMFREVDEARFHSLASSPSGLAHPPVDADDRLVALMRTSGTPLQMTGRDTGWLEQRLATAEADHLRRAGAGLFVPIAMATGRHEAFLALGLKRSEEPYTREDEDALRAIAASLALLVVAGPTPSPDRITGVFEECPECGTCYDSGASRCEQESAPLVPVTMPRTLAGRYRLARRLGRGGMGRVYEAVDTALERRVAVKVIRQEWIHNAAAIERFRREARAVAVLDHPNVVTVHDYGAEAGAQAFLVMELLEGVTLRAELERVGRLDAARTVEVFRGACAAVDAAHRRRLVHRDLKPENIFLARTGEDDGGSTVKVLDFGVAKPLVPALAGEGPRGLVETAAGVLVGTVGYMSPEQLLGEKPDVGWDLWALAVVAYECLAGALPFPVASADAWRHLVLDGRPAPLGDRLENPPAAWQHFFDRALGSDRSLRPRTAGEFFRQLQQSLG